MTRSTLATIAAALLGGQALAQSINIDFGTAAGTPPATFAAAGQSGVWNGIDLAPDVSAPLIDIAGNPVAALVSALPCPDPLSFDDPGTVGADGQLMDDFLPGLGDVIVQVAFEGLINGAYEVITYAWVPGDSKQGSTIFQEGNGQIVGGPWPGGYQAGVTHAVHQPTVADGTLAVEMGGSAWWTSGVINGIQLRHVAYPSGDGDEDGFVNVTDLLMVLTHWTTPGHGCDGIDPCQGDMNADDAVNVADLMVVITNWTG